MDTPTKVEINVATGEVAHVPLTAEEIAEREQAAELARQRAAEEIALAQAEAEAKESARAKLAALGLSEEEIAALVK